MLKLFSASLIGLLILSGFLVGAVANEDEWNALIEKEAARIDNAREFDGLNMSDEQRKRVDTVFRSHDKSKISVRVIEGDKEKPYKDIYYGGGELYVHEHWQEWNIVTNGDYIYQWKNGKQSGIRFKKNLNDIFAYIAYSTDPSFILSGLHDLYKSNPEASTVSINQETSVITARFKEPRYGFLGVIFSENPFWYRGLISKVKKAEKETVILYGLPEKYDQVPSALFDKMKDIKFEDSDRSLREHLTYL